MDIWCVWKLGKMDSLSKARTSRRPPALSQPALSFFSGDEGGPYSVSLRMGFPSDSVQFLAGTAMRTLRIRPLSVVSNLRYVIYECFIFFSRAPQNPKFDLFSVKFFKPEASVHLGMFQKMMAKHFSWAGIVLKLLA